MELRHIRYFQAICKAGSFSRAAEAVHVTQPTLSHQIKQLEDELGTHLLHRLGHRVELTEAGKVFALYCTEILRNVNQGVTAVKDLEGLLYGNLRVAVFHSFSASKLPAVFADFASRFPGVHIVALQLPRTEMQESLQKGELDFAVGYSNPDDRNFVTELLFEESLMLIVGSRHPWVNVDAVPMQRLAELPLVLLTHEFGVRHYLDDYFSRAGTPLRVVLEMNAIDPIIAVLHNTALASILPQGAVQDSKPVRKIPLLHPVPKRQAAILWRRSGHRSAAALRLAQMISAAYAEDGGVAAGIER